MSVSLSYASVELEFVLNVRAIIIGEANLISVTSVIQVWRGCSRLLINFQLNNIKRSTRKPTIHRIIVINYRPELDKMIATGIKTRMI